MYVFKILYFMLMKCFILFKTLIVHIDGSKEIEKNKV